MISKDDTKSDDKAVRKAVGGDFQLLEIYKEIKQKKIERQI